MLPFLTLHLDKLCSLYFKNIKKSTLKTSKENIKNFKVHKYLKEIKKHACIEECIQPENVRCIHQ